MISTVSRSTRNLYGKSIQVPAFAKLREAVPAQLTMTVTAVFAMVAPLVPVTLMV
jgi:hypothetical protein